MWTIAVRSCVLLLYTVTVATLWLVMVRSGDVAVVVTLAVVVLVGQLRRLSSDISRVTLVAVALWTAAAGVSR